MENLYDLGIKIVTFFQNLGDWLIPPMKFFTFLGVEEFYLLIAPLIFWCIDTAVGIRTAIMLMFSNVINNFFKLLFHEPRPYWVSDKAFAHLAESSFGIPSGHAQNSVAIWGILAHSIKKRWFWVISILLMFFIGISRIILGVHFPQDTLLGWILGCIILFIFIKIEPGIIHWLKQKTLSQRISIYFLISIGIIFIGALTLVPLRNWTFPPDWLENIKTAFPEEEVTSPLALSPQVTIGGVFFGLTLGYSLLFKGNGYNPKGNWWQLILRYLLGLIGIVIIWFGLDLIFPDGETFGPLVFRYLRYFLVGVWITYLAPVIFIKIRLAQPSKLQYF